jgi:hypothetical protein
MGVDGMPSFADAVVDPRRLSMFQFVARRPNRGVDEVPDFLETRRTCTQREQARPRTVGDENPRIPHGFLNGT